MLCVLAAAGAFVYWRVDFALDRQLDDDLVQTATAVTPYVTASGSLTRDAPRLGGDRTYQVLDRTGTVLSSSPDLGDDPLIGPSAARRALRTPVLRDIGPLLPTTREPLRAYAIALPDAASQQAAVLVVAVRRDHRDEALLELLGQLAVAGLGALLATAVVGDQLARRALRPVERYRAQAADVVTGSSGVRLDVPADRNDEVTRLGHTLNLMLAALEAALARERRFVDDASHELRTPLTLLTTRVQLALRRPRTVEEHEAVLTEIGTDVVRLTRLAEQLLEVGASDRRADRQVCDLAQVATSEVDRRLTPDSEGGDGTETAVLLRATGRVAVPLSETAAGRVISNLLANATLHGHPPVTVTVEQTAGTGRLMVADCGPGMGADTLATATRRLTRSPESLSRDGFGLGLSLVESIVTSADGELRLCCGGRHETFGTAREPPCEHGPEMTVTVLLPGAEGGLVR